MSEILHRERTACTAISDLKPAVVASRLDEDSDPKLLHRIVVVGGGAAGLERLGRRSRASVTLVECARTHLWKPLLHAVAAGSLNSGEYELSYLAQAHWHGFRYRLGEMIGLDRVKKEVHLAAMFDDEGRQITPVRSIGYDTLVIAIGSVTNDFGTPGVAQYAVPLETPAQAERFNRRVVNPDIFAIGDCAACPRPDTSTPVPPRAQAAHQEASHMVRQIGRRLRNIPLQPYIYRDFGSLVSLGKWSTVGNLMGFLSGRSIFVEGLFARLMYRSLRLMHEQALGGTWRALLALTTRALTRHIEPPVKLH